ncbi:MAG TPA: nitrous oxide reductase family maturation protein NosD [Terriglobales bacterium]|nr:nitrous oxide reductase family maturation protein NosD [Terriglobales bacterium]
MTGVIANRRATILRRIAVRSALLVWVYALAAQPTLARTLVVSETGPFQSPSQAIAAAQPGDTIEIGPGVYPGNLLLDRNLSLVGKGRPIIRGSGTGSVITLTADNCTVRGLIIEHSGPMLATEDSGILLKSDRNRVDDNDLRDILFGIYLYHANDNLISNNRITGRPYLDLGGRGSGIHIWNSERNLLTGNAITKVRDGMYLQNTYHTVIRGNRVFNLRYGLHYMWSDDNIFEDNLFYDNVAGAAVMYSHRVQMRRNVFRHNRGYSSYGILFQENDDCIFEDNIVSDNAVGIFMESMRRGKLRRNLVSANDVAIQAFGSATENQFEYNNFVDNLSPILEVGAPANTRWNGESAGNYWSDYDGYDLENDGIGDVPYKIVNLFAHLEGSYPRLRLYLDSPAAQALALAERGFPLLERDVEQDMKPLMRPADLRFVPPQIRTPVSQRAAAALLPLAMLALSALVMVKAGRA